MPSLALASPNRPRSLRTTSSPAARPRALGLPSSLKRMPCLRKVSASPSPFTAMMLGLLPLGSLLKKSPKSMITRALRPSGAAGVSCSTSTWLASGTARPSEVGVKGWMADGPGRWPKDLRAWLTSTELMMPSPLMSPSTPCLPKLLRRIEMSIELTRPSLLTSASQALPKPSLSKSAWSGLATRVQLSMASGMPSLSVSGRLDWACAEVASTSVASKSPH